MTIFIHETERRFLIEPEVPLHVTVSNHFVLSYGYITEHSRVRIHSKTLDDFYALNFEKAFLDIKETDSTLIRRRLSDPLTNNKAIELYNLSEVKFHKIRVETFLNGNKWELDFLPNSTRPFLAEHEFSQSDTIFEINNLILPDFIGREITFDKEYTGYRIAKNMNNRP